MGSLQSSQSSSVQDKQVNQALQPYLNDILSQGQAFYNAGVGAQPYTGPTVAGENQYLKDAGLNYKNMIDWQIGNIGAQPQNIALSRAAAGIDPKIQEQINQLNTISSGT